MFRSHHRLVKIKTAEGCLDSAPAHYTYKEIIQIQQFYLAALNSAIAKIRSMFCKETNTATWSFRMKGKPGLDLTSSTSDF